VTRKPATRLAPEIHPGRRFSFPGGALLATNRSRIIWRSAAALLALLTILTAPQARAAEKSAIAWHSDVETAWKTTQEQGRPLLVFVTAKQCAYCVKMKQATYADPNVAAAVNRSFVPLVLDGGSNLPLLKELGVTAYPATFIISGDAVVLDRVNGFVPPETLVKRLAAIQSTAQVNWRPAARGREY
jgi:thioredoxin-related protein